MRSKLRQEYDPALFSGTAQYYSKYRLGYPERLYDEIFKHVRASRPRLLDIGCGPGTIALALAERCRKVVAVDPDPEMLQEAQRIAEEEGVGNCRFVESTAEDIDYADIGNFDLVTFGSAIHWMNCSEIMPQICESLSRGGAIAILYTNSAGMNIWQPGKNSWQGVVTSVIQKHLGEKRRAGSDQFVRVKNEKKFEDILMQEKELNRFLVLNIPIQRSFDIASLVGLLYSTSFCRTEYFDSEVQINKFEKDLETELKSFFENKSSWTETYNASALLGIKD